MNKLILINIDPVLNLVLFPDLQSMGHEDRLVLCYSNFNKKVSIINNTTSN